MLHEMKRIGDGWQNSFSNSRHMEKYSRMEQWGMPNLTHM